MRHRILIVLCLAVAACGDSELVTPDAKLDDAVSGGPACSDGIDNDGDGKTDYPGDPGCLAPNQDDETDDCPAGPGCPQCADGIDNDGNGAIDYPNDQGCESASDTTEVINNPIACGTSLVLADLPVSGIVMGTLDTMSTSQIGTTCGGGAGASALAYRFTLTQPAVVVATTDSVFDSVLDLRAAGCTAETDEILCNDNISSTNEDSSLTQSLPAGTYFLIVSGYDTAEVGAFTLTVERLTGEGVACTPATMCGPGLVCRTPAGGAGDICTKPQCGDMLDDDGDTKSGFPADPGCTSLEDNDETDDCPTGPNCPACSNGVDDDLDTKTDYPMDTSCTSAGGQSEACNGEQDPILGITAPVTMGTIAGAHDDHNPSCVSTNGIDVLYTLKLPTMRSLTLDTIGSGFDTVLSLLPTTCAEPSLACNDEGGGSANSSKIQYANLAASSYIVAVDAYSSTPPTGAIKLNVTGVIAPGGACAAADTLGGALACPATNPCANIGGSMKCTPSACGDGMDNDADGKTDYPLDPGCTSLEDITETDTCPGVGPGCPQCADGADNDVDGKTDYPMDPSCTSASSASEGCTSTEPVSQITTASVTGTTAGATNDVAPTCNNGTATQAAPDVTYAITVPDMRTLVIANTNSFDAVTSLFGVSCGGTPVACSDEPETLTVNNLAGGTYFYTVDGDGAATVAGAFTLAISGTIQNGASCEGDLAQAGVITCASGFTCKGAVGARTCARAACIDGIDNDADGVADYPNDPGCTGINDDTESDTCPGAGCPVCSDGLDNDGDGATDYPNDPTCTSASGVSEACPASEGITPIVLAVNAGTTIGAVNDVTNLTCSSSTNTAPDLTYSVTVPKLNSFSIVNDTDFDGSVALYNSTCGGTALDCGDTPEDVEATNLAAGTYYYIVDGYGSGSGAFSFTVSGKIALNESCESPLALSGALTCDSGATCGGTMGSRTCRPAACSDGLDNDADGAIDYPFDPGCSSGSDADEANPATAATCSNGADDDTDGLTDFPADYGCSSAAGTTEAFCPVEVDPVAVITANPTTGTTTGKANNFTTTTCISSSGEDAVLVLQLPVPVASLTLDLSGTAFDTVMSLRDTSCGTQIACADQGGTGNSSKFTVTNVSAGNYSVVVDGWSGADGAFTLATTGVVASGTSCTSPLFAAGILACPMGTTCTGTPLKCQ